MKARPIASSTWLLCLCILLLLSATAGAQTYSLSSDNSADLVNITFPKGLAPPVVLRTGPRRVEVLFPAGTQWKGTPGKTASGRHVSGLGASGNSLVIETNSESFGFVASPKGDKGMLLQVFYDPAGARWSPPDQAGTKPEGQARPGGKAQGATPQAPASVATNQADGANRASSQTAAQPSAGSPAPAQPGAAGAPAQGQAAPSFQEPGKAQGGSVSVSIKPGTPKDSPASGTVPQGISGSVKPSGTPPLSPETPQTPAAGSGTQSSQAAAPGVAGGKIDLSKPAPSAQASQPVQPPGPGGKSGLGAPQGQPAPISASSGQTATRPSGKAAPGTPSPPASEQSVVPAKPAQPGADTPARQDAPLPTPSEPLPGAPISGQPGGITVDIVRPIPSVQPPAGVAGPAPGVNVGGSSGQSPVAEAGKPEAAGSSQASPSQPAPVEAKVSVGGKVGQPPAVEAGKPEAAAAVPPVSPTDEAAKAALAEKPETPPALPEKTGEAPQQGDSIEDTTSLVSGEQAMARDEYAKALSVARNLLEKPKLTNDLRESALYLQAEALYALNKDKLAETFIETNDALQQALNFNTKSMRLPRMLIKLGYLNLRQGNLPEARAYFNLLRKKYPMDEEVPLIDVYWGDYYMDHARPPDAKANYERAAQSFKDVLQKYPESRYARDAALGLSRAQFELHNYDEAAKIVDYVDKRWPRYYVENPAIRRVSADIAYKLGDYAKARDDYLWFYNLVPGDSSNDLVLARLGDVSMKLDQRDAAREFYDMAVRLYPGKEGALMAMMRMAEQGIHDAPTLQEMFKAFADPKDIQPDKIYEIIVNEFPNSPLAPLALAKLAMWDMYKEQYPEAIELVGRFVKSYPGDELEKQAVETAGQAFSKMLAPLLEQQDYKRIVELWKAYPFLASRADLFSDHDRLGVALGLYYQNAPKQALEMAEPYLAKGPSPDAQKALALILTIYRENQDWQGVLDTLRKVADWKMEEGPRRALEFAQAMALEHTGDHARSRLLWARLAADNQLDPAKRAYAVYYQARTAFERQDFDKALTWALDARTLFKEAAKDDGKARDALLLMIQADQAAGRYREALKLCEVYEKEAPENSAEWGANRLRMASLYRLLGDVDTWRKILVEMRDSQGDTLYGKLAGSELSARGLEERAGKLAGPP